MSSSIENTATGYTPIPGVLPYMLVGPGAIEAQEAAGQQQLVNSDRLPTVTGGTDDAFIAVGFTFGEPDPTDPLFRPATLPAGWSRRASDHSMHSDIVDELGRKRVGVFYKAAFYDRRANMHLVSPSTYVWIAVHDSTPIVCDDTWMTEDLARTTLLEFAGREDEEAARADEYAGRTGGPFPDAYWHDRAIQHRAAAAKARAMAEAIA